MCKKKRAKTRLPAKLVKLPPDQWAEIGSAEVWRSRHFLVALYDEHPEAPRIAIRRTESRRRHRGLTWDDLQRVKREIGHGATWAVEIYPADAEAVNVENVRHLWLLPKPPRFAWRTKA